MNKLNLNLDESKIIEGIVGSEIKSKNILKEIYFTNIKTETDFVFNKTGIEVKYKNEIKKQDFKNKRYFKNYSILSKDNYEKNTVPVYMYLFLEK